MQNQPVSLIGFQDPSGGEASGAVGASITRSGQAVVPGDAQTSVVSPPHGVPEAGVVAITLAAAPQSPMEYQALALAQSGMDAERIEPLTQVPFERVLEFFPGANAVVKQRGNLHVASQTLGISLERLLHASMREGGAVELALRGGEPFSDIATWTGVPADMLKLEYAIVFATDVMRRGGDVRSALAYAVMQRINFHTVAQRLNLHFEGDVLPLAMGEEGSVGVALKSGEAFATVASWSGISEDTLMGTYLHAHLNVALLAAGASIEQILHPAMREGGAVERVLRAGKGFPQIAAWTHFPAELLKFEYTIVYATESMGRGQDASSALVYAAGQRIDLSTVAQRVNVDLERDLLPLAMDEGGSVSAAVRSGETFEQIAGWSGIEVNTLHCAYANDAYTAFQNGETAQVYVNRTGMPPDTYSMLLNMGFGLATAAQAI